LKAVAMFLLWFRRLEISLRDYFVDYYWR